MSSDEIREAFLTFFETKHKHNRISSGSLVPGNDPTLLFTNAGMVPFKEVFLGIDKRSYDKATSSQRCVRAGGKHNDLENVGYTSRHHTYFEMLGNFSFGDYFKREAIKLSWSFLTEVLAIPEEKLWVTVYKNDKEAETIWLKEMKISQQRFSRLGDKDNFWSMGDVGPCGPCSEIFYDHGEGIAGGPPGSIDEDGDRYVEIWNLVFMQYNRDAHGELTPLPNPCIDTGMGLERIAAVMQGVHDNYDIDLFKGMLSAIGELAHCSDFSNKSMRVIADHIRSVTFLMLDGVTPSNEGRGYVLRRIIRRALRHGYRLGIQGVFLHQLVSEMVRQYGDLEPSLVEHQSQIEQMIKKEEEQFSQTLAKGMKIFGQEILALKDKELPGKLVFLLYDTYGFPPDLTADIAREKDLTIDEVGFDILMEGQRSQSKRSQQFVMSATQQLHIEGSTDFVGYELQESSASIIALAHDDLPVSELQSGEKGMVILDVTPFYAEGGGQVGDAGLLTSKDGALFEVETTQKLGQVYCHIGQLISGTLSKNDTVIACVDSARIDIKSNHSATHLLHAALRELLGKHVMQKGSLVDANRLRFDFSHSDALSETDIVAIEDMVNKAIRQNYIVEHYTTTFEEAKKQGVMALFGEKYSEDVRVIAMGDFSAELCGGTHVDRTGDIGLFIITSESACASGVRRIEAVTGQKALSTVQHQRATLHHLTSLLNCPADLVADKCIALQQQHRELTRTVGQLQKQIAGSETGDLTDHVSDINGVSVLAYELPSLDRNALRDTLDDLRSRYTSYALILASVKDERVQLVASVSKDNVSAFTASSLLRHVAEQVGGKGGGRADFAEGGGTQPEELPKALQSVPDWILKQSTH